MKLYAGDFHLGKFSAIDSITVTGVIVGSVLMTPASFLI